MNWADASVVNLLATRLKVFLRVVDGELIDEEGALCCGERLAFAITQC